MGGFLKFYVVTYVVLQKTQFLGVSSSSSSHLVRVILYNDIDKSRDDGAIFYCFHIFHIILIELNHFNDLRK